MEPSCCDGVLENDCSVQRMQVVQFLESGGKLLGHGCFLQSRPESPRQRKERRVFADHVEHDPSSERSTNNLLPVVATFLNFKNGMGMQPTATEESVVYS